MGKEKIHINIAREVVVREAGLEKEMVEVGADRGRELIDDRGDATEDRNLKEVGALDGKARITRIENVEVPETVDRDGILSCSENDQNLKAETTCGSTQREAHVTNRTETAGRDKLLESEECLEKGVAGDLSQIDSNIGQETEVKRRVVNAECADAMSSDQTTQVVVEAEVAAVDGNVLLNSNIETDTQVTDRGENVPMDIEVKEQCEAVIDSISEVSGPAEGDKLLESEALLEKGVAGDVSQIDSNIGQETKVKKQVVNAECADAMPSDQTTQVVVEAEVAAVDGNVLLNSNVETDTQVTDRGENFPMDIEVKKQCEAVIDSIIEVSGPAERDKLLESEECLERGVAGDLSQIDSNIGQETEVKKRVVNAECADAMSSDQPTQVVVEAEVAAVDGNVLLNSNVETDTQVIDSGENAPMDIGEVVNSNMDVLGSVEFEEHLKKVMAGDFAEIDSKSGPQVGVEGQEAEAEQVGLHEEQEMKVEVDIVDAERSKVDEEKFLEQAALNPGSIVKVHQASYQLPSQNEGEFSVSDLVWGKVRSHPWWPGQIFDPADSSEKAMKHHKKDCFLVAYFGDRTFAWNEASQLKPFQTHFSHVEKQSNSEAFQNAVDCALEEISRRVEFGLACSCIPKDAYDKIKFQIVENTGIRQESSTRGVDRSASASSFEPDKIIEYVKTLALLPSGGSDRLELVIAKAQLRAFCRLKGYCSLPEFQCCGQLLESDTDTLVSEDRMHSSEVFEHPDDELTSFKQEILKSQNSSSNKRKHNLKDDVFYRKKERSLSELMGGTIDSPDDDNWSDGKTTGTVVSPSSGKKRKTVDYHDDHGPQDGRKTISFAKVSSTTPPYFPKPSFKIGDCIRRVASQLTGSPSILKCNSERLQKLDGSNDIPAGDEADAAFQDSEDAQRGRMNVSAEYSSLDDLLSQLQIAAQVPLKRYGFLNIIVSFFSDFRNSVVEGQYSGREFLDKVIGKRKKSSHSVTGSPETFEFEDMSDTYWTDRVIQNGSEEQCSRKNRKREYQIVPVELEKPLQVSRRPYSRKRYSDGNNAVAAEKPVGSVNENSPAEIVMNFSEVNSVPSETNLNKMFRHFGPLKESETEVDRDTSRARVVFKHSSDAEVAFSSAGRFSIFGPTLVNYQINYTPSALFKASPMDTAQDHEMQFDLASLEVNLV